MWRTRGVEPAKKTQHRVTCRGLTVKYGDLVAADGINLDVAAGEVFGLLGPNGAGKTSVIRALTTILTPAGGSATVAGADLADRNAIRCRIGVLPESSGYPRAQTGLSYLRFYGELYGFSRATATDRATELLDQFGLGLTSKRISHYSRGMRQRLGLCRALINRPDVLFLDEPTLGLDPAGKEDVVKRLAAVAVSDSTSVVLCTHLLDEVERVCDRVAIMAEGRLLTTGTVDHVIDGAPISRNARLRVHPDDIASASEVARHVEGVERVGFDNARPGDLDVHLDPGSAPGTSTALLAGLLAADVEVRSFDGGRASLNDAFLALTSDVGVGS